MNKNFRASICIPTYQMGDVIDNCLRSLLMGTSDDIEIVIVDDGSMDNTYQVCEQFTKSNPRFNYYKLDRSPSRKLGYTRNIAASFAKDDKSAPTKPCVIAASSFKLTFLPRGIFLV